ncbi:MAG TPA: TonB-dependent receptor [Ferruginibacter sp.]|nr:TonB-dependent receptor [Ferruginibacter sp.]
MPKMFTSGLFALAAVIIFNPAYGQKDTARLEHLTLKELLNVKVTTVSKNAEELEKTPATVMVITEEQIRRRGYQSLLDLMYDLPDVKVDDKIYSGLRNTFTVRGTQGQEKFVILLDGNRISSPSGEAMPIMENYPVNFAEQIEVVYGPASALYGADALSIVINIISKKASSRKSLVLNASSLAGSNGYTNNSLFIAKKLSDHVNLVISGQYSYDKQPDYSQLYKDDSLLSATALSTGTFNTIYGPFTPTTPVKPKYEAPLEAYNIYVALHADNFSFSFFRNYFKAPTAYGNNTSNAVYNKEVFMAQSINVANASYKKTFGKITFTTLLTASEYKLDPRSNYRNLYTAMEPAYKFSACTMVKAEQQVDYKASEKLRFTAGGGFESYYSLPQSTDLEKPVDKKEHISGIYLGTRAYYRSEGLPAQFYFIRYQNTSAYFQTQYSPVEKVNITLGARYDINSRYGSSFNPRLGIVYRPSEKTTIKLLYGSAFIAPSPSDSYAQYGSFDTQDSGKTYHSYFLHLPNPGLKPIRSQNAEMNVKTYLSDNFSLTLNGYFTSLKGLHAFADDNTSTQLYNNAFNGIPVDYIEVFINQGRQQNYGGSIQANYKNIIGSVHMNSYASLSYVTGKVDNAAKESLETTPDTRLQFISPFMFHIGTDLKTGKFSCSPRLIMVGKQNLAGISDSTQHILPRQKLAGYALLNISVRYNVSKRFSVFSNITNALNQQYKNVGFNMDLNKKDTELFYGQRQDPIRIMGGINFTL